MLNGIHAAPGKSCNNRQPSDFPFLPFYFSRHQFKPGAKKATQLVVGFIMVQSGNSCLVRYNAPKSGIVCCYYSFWIPTESFATLKPYHLYIGDCDVVQKRRAMDFVATKL